MSKRLSELYGMDIYSTSAELIGRVEEIILNLEKGGIMRLCLKPFRGDAQNDAEVRRILQQESISYEDVKEVGDIVITNKPSTLRSSKTK
jgi:sporulation protein YlmC with PRC-barrel domain